MLFRVECKTIVKKHIVKGKLKKNQLKYQTTQLLTVWGLTVYGPLAQCSISIQDVAVKTYNLLSLYIRQRS